MIYDQQQLMNFLLNAEKKEVRLQCTSNTDARRLSFALRRYNSNKWTVRIAVSLNEVILTPRPIISYQEIKVDEGMSE